MPMIPKTASRSTLDSHLHHFLTTTSPCLHLGSPDFLSERQHHSLTLGIHNLPKSKHHPIHRVEHTAIPGPHGTIPVRILYPSSTAKQQQNNSTSENTTSNNARETKPGGLIYFHGGGYTVGSIDEFENGLRILAEEASVVVFAVEYRLAPEWKYPVQLDEYESVLDWIVHGPGARETGVDSNRIAGSGDSAGGNMTASVALRRRDRKKRNLCAQILLYPEARVPFDTFAAVENNSGYYLECNGIFLFAHNYLPLGTPPSHPYISPGMQPVSHLKNLPPAAVFTCGFDPLRDVGVEYASKLQEAGNRVVWNHYDSLTHGFLQFAPMSDQALKASKDVAKVLSELIYA